MHNSHGAGRGAPRESRESRGAPSARSASAAPCALWVLGGHALASHALLPNNRGISPAQAQDARNSQFGDGTFLACVGVTLGVALGGAPLGVVLARGSCRRRALFWARGKGIARRKEITDTLKREQTHALCFRAQGTGQLGAARSRQGESKEVGGVSGVEKDVFEEQGGASRLLGWAD
jgi:hypothetical protein